MSQDTLVSFLSLIYAQLVPPDSISILVDADESALNPNPFVDLIVLSVIAPLSATVSKVSASV
jgi:hypothetical protein